MTPDHKEVEKMANELWDKFPPIVLDGRPIITDFLTKLLAAQEADFQARLADAVGYAMELRSAMFNHSCGHTDAQDKEVNWAGLLMKYGPNAERLSSPDALRAQAREAEIRAEALRKAGDWFKAWKDMPASYERAGEALHRMADEAERAKAKE